MAVQCKTYQIVWIYQAAVPAVLVIAAEEKSPWEGLQMTGVLYILVPRDCFYLKQCLEIMHYAAFHLGLNYLSKYKFLGFQYTKG